MTVHYKKSGIDMKKFTGFKYDLEKLLSLLKDNKSKWIDLDNTMPLWPKNTEKTMKKKVWEPFLSQQENHYQNWLAVSSKH